VFHGSGQGITSATEMLQSEYSCLLFEDVSILNLVPELGNVSLRFSEYLSVHQASAKIVSEVVA
jgi:hypothetical protein